MYVDALDKMIKKKLGWVKVKNIARVVQKLCMPISKVNSDE